MIEVEKLTKLFDGVKAVDNLSFHVPKGQVLGFLGPNGAGKSTTMKMLTCFLKPSSGVAKIGGASITEDSLRVRSQIGYLPESAPSYGEMTVCEFLTFIAEMRGMRGAEISAACERMRATCFLDGVWHQPIETLSKGYRQRVGFAQALIHDPPVLILDEPTDGLDPNQKHEVRQLIKRMGADKTIILSTHILEEVDAICQRVIIIAGGKIVADSTPAALKEQSMEHNAVTLSLADGELERARHFLEKLHEITKVELLERPRPTLRVYPRDRRPIINAVSQAARDQNWRVDEIRVEQGRLDEVFRNVTGQNAKRGAAEGARH